MSLLNSFRPIALSPALPAPGGYTVRLTDASGPVACTLPQRDRNAATRSALVLAEVIRLHRPVS